MTFQTHQPTPEETPVVLTDEQPRRVADALEDAQSENTRKNYASQRRKFRAGCEREEQLALPASPEVVAAYAAELADDGKNMSTVRLLSNRELPGAARLIWKETAPERGWLDIVLPFVLSMRACTFRKPLVSAGVTSSMPRTVPVSCTSNGRKLTLMRLRFLHAIADPGLGKDVPWIVGVVSQLAPQVPHGGTKQCTLTRVPESPDPLQNLVLGQYAPGADRQLVEELVFSRGQPHGSSG